MNILLPVILGLAVIAGSLLKLHYQHQAKSRKVFIADVRRIAESNSVDSPGTTVWEWNINDFALDLFRHGVYVLPCGGGVVPEPRLAIGRLKYKYGEDGLLWGSYLVYTRGDHFLSKALPEGTGSVVLGILYHLGNQDVLEKLISIRRSKPVTGEPFIIDPRQSYRDSGEALIAGLCERLGRPLPEGINRLSPEDKSWLFN